MQFVAVINSFNRKNLLVEAVESLVRVIDPKSLDYAIVVFEAGSTDGSRQWLSDFAQAHPQVNLEVLEASAKDDDTSFAAGVNLGCAHALKRYPDLEFLLLYETDNWLANAEPIHQAIKLLRSHAKLAAMGFTVRSRSGRVGGWGEAFPTLSAFVLGGQLCQRLGIPRAEMAIQETEGSRWFIADVVYTSPLVIKASAWLESGGMDARVFPFSDSDVDWAWKIAQKGYQQGVLVTDAVVHDNLSTLSNWSGMRVVYFHEARFRLLRKYRGSGVVLAIPALFVRHLLEYGLLFALALAGRRPWASLKKRTILLKRVWRGYKTA
jgi:GT2 family glycosyltransferase